MPVAPRARPRHALLLVAVALGLLATGCGDDEPSGGGPSEIGDAVTIDREATTTTATSATTEATPTTAPAPTGAPSPEAASEALYQAFVAGDRAAAAVVAEPPAIEAVFAATPGSYGAYRGCDTGEFDTSGCLYRDRATDHTIQFDLERRDAAWVVTGAFFSAS